jgi:hypothetical protein
LIIDIKHHLGKTYYKLGKYENNYYENSYKIFKSIIEICDNCYKTKLQLFRILNQKKYENEELLNKLIEEFISLSESKDWKYLTVILDFYNDILSSKYNYENKILNNKYLANNILLGLEQNIDQIYKVLPKILQKLKWNKEKYSQQNFNSICSYLENFDINKFNLEIKNKFYLSLVMGECSYRDKFYLLYEEIEENLDDFGKFQISKILNSFKDFQKTKDILDKINLETYSKKEFIFQQLAKACVGLNKCQQAYEYIKQAIEILEKNDKYNNSQKEKFKKSFLKDKEKIENNCEK